VGQPERPLYIFLGTYAQTHAGYERPSDLLNGRDCFVPAQDPDGRTLLLQLDAVQVLSVPGENELVEDDAARMAAGEVTRVQVDVTLEDGTKYRGELRYALPEAQRRFQSYLNLPERFFRLWDGDTARLIHKHRVRCVAEI
jgi:hypothetical protein